MKRRSKILLVLVVLLVIGAALLLPHGGSRRQVEAYKRQLIAQGEKLTMIELAPPSQTNLSNGAYVLTNTMASGRVPNDYPPMMKFIAPGVAMVGHLDVQAAEMASYRTNAALASRLREISRAQTIDFHLDYSLGSEIPLIYVLPEMKSAGMVLSIAATQALHEKDYSEAWQDLLAAADLVGLYTNEPFIICDLVRIATANVVIGATWEALQEEQWTDAQLAELQAKWEGINFLKNMEKTLAMEKAWDIDYLDKARKKDKGETLVNSSTGESGFLRGLWDKTRTFYDRYPRFWMWKSSWSYDEETCSLQMATAAKEVFHRMAATQAAVPALVELKKETESIVRAHPGWANDSSSPFPTDDEEFTKYGIRLAKAEVVRRLMVTAIALKRWRLQHHSCPSSLSELVPEYLREVPIDFMNGKPLRYQVKPDGDFLLYSVGEDGKDDQGDATDPETTLGRVWLYGRDIVWPRAATAAEVENFKQGEAKKQPTEDK